MKKIVWLASWFPTLNNPFTGDFIERHAQAVSRFQPVHIIHVERYNRDILVPAKTAERVDENYPGVSVVIRYYRFYSAAGLDRIFSYCWSLWLYRCLVKQYIQQNGKPQFIHVHVSLRCGLVALYYKLFYKIPFIVTEHYAGYMPGAKSYAKGIGPFNYFPLKLILQNASAVTVVSKALGDALRQKFTIKNLLVIPNVVNTDIFKPLLPKQVNAEKIFIHVSTLGAQKNPEQMLEAFALLKHKYNCSFQLWIIGPHMPHLNTLALNLTIAENIQWYTESAQTNIALLMQRADALVLYSRFESFGCVNIEAMACGLPVIVSDIDVFKEYLAEGVTAHFAATNNPAALAKVLYNFIVSEDADTLEIANHAQRFNYENMGKQLALLYAESINA